MGSTHSDLTSEIKELKEIILDLEDQNRHIKSLSEAQLETITYLRKINNTYLDKNDHLRRLFVAGEKIQS